MTKINSLIKQMDELAKEIIELEARKDDGDHLIYLYDCADTVFSAKNVKTLLQNHEVLHATIEMQDQKIQELEAIVNKPVNDVPSPDFFDGDESPATVISVTRARLRDQGMTVVTDSIGE